MSAWLEVRIPISPLDHYFNRVQLIAHSIRSLGPSYADVQVRVTVGADQEPEDLHARFPWSKAAGIDWVWVDRAEFRHWKDTRHEYIATMMERFRPPFSSRHVLLLDADVLAMRPFEELRDVLDETPGLAAMMAHAAPFGPRKRRGDSLGRGWLGALTGRQEQWDNSSGWQRLFSAAGTPVPEFKYEYANWGITEHDPRRRFGPPYFNTGIVMASAMILEQIYEPYMRALDRVRAILDTYFFEQIGLTLALLETRTPFHVLPLRYNFPNQPEFDRGNPDELRNVRFLHFLRTNIVRREADFQTLAAVEDLTARRDLEGSNEMLRARVAALLPAVKAERASATGKETPPR